MLVRHGVRTRASQAAYTAFRHVGVEDWLAVTSVPAITI